MVSHSLEHHVSWHTDPIENEVRLWTYIASKPLSNEEVKRANTFLSAFVGDWTSHGDKIHGTFGWIGRHAVVIASPVSQSLSGCGIDQNISAIRSIEEAIGVKMLDRNLVLSPVSHGEYSTRRIDAIDTMTDEQLVFKWNTTRAHIESTPIFVPLRESGFKQLPKNTGLFSSL
ncbi:MAG TPA: hypothetical protein DEO99_05490 [Bacteroidetes bacterium]|nr:hypothetical protein [Bacteroidota bacterium]